MATIEVKCDKCGGENVHKHDQQSGHPHCRYLDCKSVFLISSTNKAYEEGTKEKIILMAHNGSGIRDTAMALEISPK